MAEPDSISLAAERAADRLRSWVRDRTSGGCKVLSRGWDGCECPLCLIDRLDAARVLLQAYEVAEQEIRDQVEGTVHEQPPTVTGPAYLMAVFESLRVGKA